MKVIDIFEKLRGQLFAAQFEGRDDDELNLAFAYWRDEKRVRSFFLENRADLSRFDSTLKVKKAIDQVMYEADEIYDELYEAFRNANLEELFVPLDNREVSDTRYNCQKMKARSPRYKPMLRIYAIRTNENIVIGGSAIKISDRMIRGHLRTELHKLELLKQYLQSEPSDNEPSSEN